MFVRTLAAVAAVLGCCALPALAEAPYSFESTPGKLPKTVVPLDYNVVLHTNVKANTFTGHESVSVRVRTATAKVVVDTHDVTVSKAAVDGAPARIATDNEKQTTTLTLGAPVRPGTHAVTMTFAGKLGTDPSGFFHQEYTVDGAKHVMLATQMES